MSNQGNGTLNMGGDLMSENKLSPLRLVRLNWDGPFVYPQVAEMLAERDYGLYQVCAYHTVFGPNSLVYIGKAERQTFGNRFSQHWESWLKMEREPSIYIARISREDFIDEPDWDVLLSDIERLSIHYHTPPYNSQFITSYSGQALHVQCWGERGRMMQEFSSHWPLPRPDDTLPE